MTPNRTAPAAGARRYTYNSASYLVRAENHNGTAYQPQAEMVYNGLGQRVALTAWTGGISLTTRYVLDLLREASPLAATANGQTTFYTYGRGPLGELTNQWTYYLVDGDHTVRQLSDASGSITLARSYTPWGEVLEQHGSGNLTWGYFGGLLDAATGLIYAGNGQYYDPKTGRFLSPVGKGRNPYLPMSRPDPLSAALGPVALMALLATRRRKSKSKDKWNGLLMVLLVVMVGVSVGAGLTACIPPEPPPPTEPPTVPPPGRTPTQPPPGRTPTPTPPPPSRTPTPMPTSCPTPTSTPTPVLPTPSCTAGAGQYCINPKVDDERTMVAHVLFQEGGSTIGPDAMRNIALVIRNRVGVPEFATTILGVISQGNGDHFNGWRASSAREAGFYWNDALGIADLLIAGNPLGASPEMTSKTRYFFSCGAPSSEVPADSNYVHHDEGGGRAQYYYEHLPNPLSCVPPTPTPNP